MRVKYSWCKKTLVFDDDDEAVSHGICLPCALKALEEGDVDPKLFLTYALKQRQPKRIYSDEDGDE